jgi:maltose-binding protein MalE
MTYDIYPLILQAGGRIIDSATNKAVFNTPEGVKAVEWYVERVNKDKVVAPGILSNGEREKRANFASGNIAMMFEGPWGISIQKQLNPNLEFGIAPLPTNVTNGTMVRGAMNTIAAQSQNKEAGVEVPALDLRPRGRRDVVQRHGRIPVAQRRDRAGMVQGAQGVPALRAAGRLVRRAVAVPRHAQCRADEQDHDHRDPERGPGQEEREAGAR